MTTGSTVRTAADLVGALLPRGTQGRDAVLAAARVLDMARPDEGAAMALIAFRRWQNGELVRGPAGDLVVAMADALRHGAAAATGGAQ